MKTDWIFDNIKELQSIWFFLCSYLFVTHTNTFTDEMIQCLGFASKQSRMGRVCVCVVTVDESRLAVG